MKKYFITYQIAHTARREWSYGNGTIETEKLTEEVLLGFRKDLEVRRGGPCVITFVIALDE